MEMRWNGKHIYIRHKTFETPLKNLEPPYLFFRIHIRILQIQKTDPGMPSPGPVHLKCQWESKHPPTSSAKLSSPPIGTSWVPPSCTMPLRNLEPFMSLLCGMMIYFTGVHCKPHLHHPHWWPTHWYSPAPMADPLGSISMFGEIPKETVADPASCSFFQPPESSLCRSCLR